MAEVLEFLPREEYDRKRWEDMAAKIAAGDGADTDPAALTENEIYRIYFNETQTHCLRMVRAYKHTGVWNSELDQRMVKVIKELQDICKSLAHAKSTQTPTKYEISGE